VSGRTFTRDGEDAGHTEEDRHVLRVIHLVEDGLTARLDVHRGAEHVAALEGHGDGLLSVAVKG
jgi:hypothetical protein